jgi:hypothetical protein
MTAFRKTVGLIIIILFGLPLLFGIIWAVGLTQGVLTPQFLSDLPREIIAEMPDLIDEVFEEGQSEDMISDRNTRAWFQAMAKTGKSPKDLMKEIGLLDWMETELSDSIRDIGDMLRGERRIRPIVIDLYPLKQALRHEAIDSYVSAVLDSLPPCDDRDIEEWMDALDRDVDWYELPACRPADLELARNVLMNEKERAVSDIPSEVEIFEGVRHIPFGLSRFVALLSYFLFFIPAVFIFIGSLIAATSMSGFFRWSGISVFLGGLFSLLPALAVRYISPVAMGFWYTNSWTDRWTTELGELVFDKMRWIPMEIIRHLFSPVVTVALIVCVLGVVLFAFSFVARGKASTQTAGQSPDKQEPEKQVSEESKPEKRSEKSEEKTAETKPEKKTD